MKKKTAPGLQLLSSRVPFVVLVREKKRSAVRAAFVTTVSFGTNAGDVHDYVRNTLGRTRSKNRGTGTWREHGTHFDVLLAEDFLGRGLGGSSRRDVIRAVAEDTGRRYPRARFLNVRGT